MTNIARKYPTRRRTSIWEGIAITVGIIALVLLSIALWVGAVGILIWGIVDLATGHPASIWNVGAIVLGAIVIIANLVSKS